MSSVPLQLYNTNIQFLSVGPILGGVGVKPLPGAPITDLVLTASLYQGRDITNPAATPGSLVNAFGTGGSILLPHVGGGVYQVQVPAFTVAVGTYQLVLDAPVSPSGFQLHRERLVSLLTAS